MSGCIPSRGSLALATALIAAVGPDARAQRSPSPPRPAASCQLLGTRDASLTLRGHSAYIEPQAFVSDGDRLLLVGRPTYVWRKGGPVALIAGDSTVGAVLDGAGHAESLPSPIAPRLVNDMRAAAATKGSWAVMFAEAEPRRPQDTPQVTAYWFGITDGTRWKNLTRLPTEGMSPRSISASDLVRTPHGYVLGVPIDRGARRDVLIVEWGGDRLRSEIVETKAAGYVSMAASAGGDLLLAVVRPDTTEREDENSLFVYQRDAGARSWRALRRVARGAGRPVRDPTMSITNRDIVLTWRATPPASPAEAYAVVGQPLEVATTPLFLGSDVEQALIAWRDGKPMWVLAAAPARGEGARLRVVAQGDSGIVTIAEVASPFHRPIAAAWLGSRLFLSSGVAARTDTEPPVQSRVLSIDFRCGAAP